MENRRWLTEKQNKKQFALYDGYVSSPREGVRKVARKSM